MENVNSIQATGSLADKSALQRSTQNHQWANKTLVMSAQFWFVVAAVGQLMFVAYISAFYGGAALRGETASWTEVISHGVVKGDPMGNVAISAHLLLAATITLGGVLQLIPRIRTWVPVFHRWNGRVYILSAFIISLSGIYIIWTRGTVGTTFQHLGTSLNAVLIMLCAVLTLTFAMQRNFARHRRWALRLFILVSGVWFFRVGLMFWLTANQGPVGMDMETFSGPFLAFLAYGQYLVPLAILELYLRVRDAGQALSQYLTSALIVISTCAMAVGIVVASLGMWLPRL